MDATPELRIALVGCGAIAEWHLTAWRTGAPRTAVTACVDIDGPRAERLAAAAGAAAYTDLGEVFADPSIDAVDIMLPHHLHEEVCLAAVAAGKHVLLEKPLAPTVPAAERICAAARATDRVVMLAENAQYWPEVDVVAAAIEAGDIGEVVTARAWHCFPPMGDFFAGSDGELPWRFDVAKAGGGVAIDAGSHWLRPLRRWLGEIDEVVAVTGHPYPDMQGESMCRALCRVRGGVVASFDALLVPGAVAMGPLFQVTGTAGELVVEALGDVRLFDGSAFEGTVIATGGYMESYPAEMADFEAAVLDGTPPAAGPDEALGELRAALAMYRSAESGRWEKVWE